MNLFFASFILCLFSFTSASFAYAPKEGNVTGTFGPYLFRTKFPGSTTGARSPETLGFGLVAVGDISERGSLEIGMFYMNKVFFREKDDKYVGEKTQIMHVTMGYRRWFSEFLSGSLAVYSAYPMGMTTLYHSDFAPGTEVETSARDKTSYGLELAIQNELWNYDRFAVVIDGRYAYSLSKKESEQSDHYGIMIGFRYFIQEKQKREKRPTDI